jgi:heme oxygenase
MRPSIPTAEKPASERTASAAAQLRAGTRTEHDAVERLPLMARLMRGQLDSGRYADVLQRHYAALRDWELTQAGWLMAMADPSWRYRWRLPALRQDLAALGMPVQAHDLPAPKLHLPVQDEAAAWGMLYVVEGSALGGRIIAQGLRQRAPSLSAALSYFDAGRDDARSWRNFQRRLDAALPDARSRSRAQAGAVAMFDHFHRQFAGEAAA